jgi:hypothetical protein
VQIVHPIGTNHTLHVASQSVEIDVVWYGLHENVYCLPQQLPCAKENQ